MHLGTWPAVGEIRRVSLCVTNIANMYREKPCLNRKHEHMPKHKRVVARCIPPRLRATFTHTHTHTNTQTGMETQIHAEHREIRVTFSNKCKNRTNTCGVRPHKYTHAYTMKISLFNPTMHWSHDGSKSKDSYAHRYKHTHTHTGTQTLLSWNTPIQLYSCTFLQCINYTKQQAERMTLTYPHRLPVVPCNKLPLQFILP